MAISKNVAFNYISKATLLTSAIIFLPLLLKYVGSEAYGLIGFYGLLMSWMVLLDMGFSPALTRVAAKARLSMADKTHFVKAYVSLLLFFKFLFFIIVSLFVYISPWIGSSWLKDYSQIGGAEVESSILLMGVIIGLRLLYAIKRAALVGVEDQVWLSKLEFHFALVRYAGGLLFVIYVTSNILAYFILQVLVAVCENLVSSRRVNRCIEISPPLSCSFYWNDLKAVLPISLTLAYTTMLWVLVSQIDKLILSSILPLEEFGYLALLAIISNGLIQVTSPVSEAIQPRLVSLASISNDRLITLYRLSTRLMVAITFSIALTMALNSAFLLMAWTGDTGLAVWGAEILPWYVIAFAFLAVSRLVFMLQLAYGDMRLHAVGSTIISFIQIPVMGFSAYYGGPFWSGVAWCLLQFLVFLFWNAIVHNKFFPRFHVSWLFHDVLFTFGKVMLGVLVFFYLSGWGEVTGRWVGIVYLCIMTLAGLLSVLIFDKEICQVALTFIKRVFESLSRAQKN